MEPKVRTRRDDRPEIILDAAEDVLRRSGARALTIDAVAAEASLSKGGVLHHYSSKDALIRALVSRKIRRLRAEIARHQANQPDGAVSPALGMVANARETYGEERGFPRALLLATTETPDALAEFQDFIAERLQAMTAIEGRPGAGAVLMFAILGVMVGRALGFHDIAGTEADDFFDALERTAQALGES